MEFDVWFHKQDKLIQVLLLFIPFVNYLVEVLVRWSAWLKSRDTIKLVLCIIVTLPTGIIIGLVDAIWILLYNKLLLE